jgi:2-oxoglutarate ferredoxin oxidoreductase subunit alpha
MAHAGEGYKFHVTGLTHDEHGYPNMTPQTQDKLVRRLQSEIHDATDRITLLEEKSLDNADVIVVSYGITSRVARRAIELGRQQGLRVGKLRLITCWPFPEKRIRQLAATTKAFVVPELNLGQMVREVERAVNGKAKTFAVPHAGGSVHRPEDILKVIVEASR